VRLMAEHPAVGSALAPGVSLGNDGAAWTGLDLL
jgi:hypothetical protein